MAAQLTLNDRIINKSRAFKVVLADPSAPKYALCMGRQTVLLVGDNRKQLFAINKKTIEPDLKARGMVCTPYIRRFVIPGETPEMETDFVSVGENELAF